MSDTDDGAKAGDGVKAVCPSTGSGQVAGESAGVEQDTAAALRFEQAKNKVLMDQVIGLEDEVVNRVMADFDAVVSDETRPFWREQLLANREQAEVALTELVNAKTGVAGTRRPMHNRAVSRPVVPAVGGGASAGGETDERAARIRNRAHEISRADRVAFPMAFRRAELEFGGG
jgi:hypothetical protein